MIQFEGSMIFIVLFCKLVNLPALFFGVLLILIACILLINSLIAIVWWSAITMLDQSLLNTVEKSDGMFLYYSIYLLPIFN